MERVQGKPRLASFHIVGLTPPASLTMDSFYPRGKPVKARKNLKKYGKLPSPRDQVSGPRLLEMPAAGHIDGLLSTTPACRAKSKGMVSSRRHHGDKAHSVVPCRTQVVSFEGSSKRREGEGGDARQPVLAAPKIF